MKNKILLALIIFNIISNTVYAEENIAGVDLQQIVSNSSQVKQLKEAHAKRMNELEKIIVNWKS